MTHARGDLRSLLEHLRSSVREADQKVEKFFIEPHGRQCLGEVEGEWPRAVASFRDRTQTPSVDCVDCRLSHAARQKLIALLVTAHSHQLWADTLEAVLAQLGVDHVAQVEPPPAPPRITTYTRLVDL